MGVPAPIRKWIERHLEQTGAKNKVYDSGLDGIVDNADKLDGKDASDFVLKAGDVMRGILNMSIGSAGSLREYILLKDSDGTQRFGLSVASDDTPLIDIRQSGKPLRIYNRADDANALIHCGGIAIGSCKLNSLVADNKVPDSDKVDGKHASDLANVDLSNVSDGTILNKIKNVDGAGSGLDADKLDGLHASSFARNPLTADLDFSWHRELNVNRNFTDQTGNKSFDTIYQAPSDKNLLLFISVYLDGRVDTSLEVDISQDNNTWTEAAYASRDQRPSSDPNSWMFVAAFIPRSWYYKVRAIGNILNKRWWEIEL